MENSNNTGKIVGAMLLGAAIGVGLGLLFAPQKGSETRQKLAEEGGKLSEDLKQKLSDLLAQAKKETTI